MREVINNKYYVLLALAKEPLHGLGIQQQIVRDTLGMYVQQSTIYASLKALGKQGCVQKLEGYPVTYRLTDKGRKRLEFATRDLRIALREAKSRL